MSGEGITEATGAAYDEDVRHSEDFRCQIGVRRSGVGVVIEMKEVQRKVMER